MARGPARSQRASRSQPGPSQSQRRRRADDDEEDVDDNGAHGVEDDAMDGGDGDSVRELARIRDMRADLYSCA
jgi:hypothetical protein